MAHWSKCQPISCSGIAAPGLHALQGPPKHAIIVGMNEQGIELAERMADSPYSNIDLVGFFDDREAERLAQGPAMAPRRQTRLNSRTTPRTTTINLIYLSLPMATQPRILNILDELRDTTASVYFVPDLFVTDLIQGQMNNVCNMPVVSVCETPFTGTNAILKRGSDIVLSLLIIALLSPILLAIAIAVKYTSPGPVIFKQRRYGLDGEEIIVYKFRSMTVCEDGPHIAQAQKNDHRVHADRRLPAQVIAG